MRFEGLAGAVVDADYVDSLASLVKVENDPVRMIQLASVFNSGAGKIIDYIVEKRILLKFSNGTLEPVQPLTGC